MIYKLDIDLDDEVDLVELKKYIKKALLWREVPGDTADRMFNEASFRVSKNERRV